MGKKNKKGKAKKDLLYLLKKKAGPALNSTALVGIAASSGSPTEAWERAYLKTGDVNLALAAKNLAKIKRDYGKKAFDSFVSSVVSSTSPDDPQGRDKSKGEQRMEKQGTKTENQEQLTIPQIPLKELIYRLAVNGTYSRNALIQRYTNDAESPVEVVYVFPLPDEATVVFCKMTIGQKTITAQIKEREVAKKEYQKAVDAGHHGALMEQERPNIFTMNVGGIEPGESIEVEIHYVQRIPWQSGHARVRVPLTVAPRFIPGMPTGKQAGGWSPDTDEVPDASRITPPVAREGVPYHADISILFSPGFRCKVTSPSHEAIVGEQVVGKSDAIEIKTGQIKPDRDFTLVYKPIAKTAQISLHQGSFGNEKFLQANIVPPEKAEIVASEIVLLLDVSGSMNGAALEGMKILAKNILTRLRDQKLGHQVSVIAFETSCHLLFPMGDITDAAVKLISELQSMGGTELGNGLTLAHQQFTGSSAPKYILLITDGETNAVSYFGSGARIIAAGISSAIDDSMLKELANKTGGTNEWIYPGEDYTVAANSLIGKLSGPVLKDVKVRGNGKAVGIEDVFEGRPASVIIRYDQELPAEITISGKGPSSEELTWTLQTKDALASDFVHQIWAREKIRESREKDVQARTSLKYGVICRHTSFVAISEKEVPGEKPVRIEIPVELPAGWDYDSIFGSTPQKAFFAFHSVGFLNSPITAGISRPITPPGDDMLGIDFLDVSEGGATEDFFESEQSDFPDEFAKLDKSVAGMPGTKGNKINASDPDDGEVSANLEADDLDSELPKLPDGIHQKLNSRFSQFAKDPVDKLIACLVIIDQGHHDLVRKIFNRLGLTIPQALALSEEKRAMAYYFAIRLSYLGLKLKQKVMGVLAREPRSEEARAWWQLARQDAGHARQPITPPAGDGSEYFAWKTGRGDKPELGSWSYVP